MHIEIPSNAEELLRRNATSAGFDDVNDYVVHLILHDTPEEAVLQTESNSQRIDRALEVGHASELAHGDGKHVIADVRRRLGDQQKPADG